MSVLHDPEEFGKRVSAAKAYAGFKKPAFAKAVGVSVPTVTRWEEGAIGSIGATVPARQALAQRIIAATGCPPEWFDLVGAGGVAPDVSERIEELAGQVETLRRVALGDEDAELLRAMQFADDVERLYGSKPPQHEEPGGEVANG